MAKTTSTGKTAALGQQIGTVKIVSGNVTATGADGIARTLKAGDAVYLDDIIKTGDLSFIQVELNTGAHFELGRNSQATLDQGVLQPATLAQQDTADVEAIQAAILAGQDPTQVTPPPAAGPGAGGPGGDDGHGFVVVNFDDQQGLVNSGFNTSGLAFAAAGTLEETAPLIIPPPGISINDVTVNEGAGTATFTVTLDAASANTVTVNFTTANGSATAGSDYTAGSGVVSFAPGVTSQTITVPITNDNIFEGTENFFVNLTAPVNGDIVDAQGVGTIIDNEAQPSLTINDVTVNEAAGTATFTVTLSGPSATPVTLDFATANGTATAGLDYTGQTGSLSFAPGVVSQTITVPIINDAIVEGAETYTVNLTNVSGATIADNQGLGTIIDNDAPPLPPPPPGLPTLSINDVTVGEGSTATFTVTLSSPSAVPVTVNFVTSAGTATPGLDYGVGEGGDISGTLTFAPGVTTQTVNVDALFDFIFEGNETFNVTLSAPTNATIADGAGLGTIIDNSGAPSLSIDDVTVSEGGLATFTVTLSSASANPITVDVATSNGSAVAGSDFTGSGLQTLTFAPGVTTQTFSVQTLPDTISEGDETFNVNLSNATGGATIADNLGLGTITDNQGLPSLSVNDQSVIEGNTATFTVTLSNPSSQTVTVNFSTANGTAISGGLGVGENDYGTTTGTLIFLPGETTKTVDVTTNNDAVVEGTENFTLNLTGPTNATISDGTGTGTIADNDGTPSLIINDVTVNEGDGIATFTVTLSATSASTVTVDFATADGTAIAGADYTTTNGSLSFAPGTTIQTITVPILNDTVYEGNETFAVNLTNPSNATIADSQGLGTIVDNDAVPTASVAVSPASVLEDGATNLTYTVTLDHASAFATTVNFTLTGTATQGTDYTPSITGSITIAAGSLTGDIIVDPAADSLFESDETVIVTLTGGTTNGQAIGIGTASATGTITNDDTQPTISINDVTVNESAGTATFTVTLSGPSANTVTVDFATADGTAKDGVGVGETGPGIPDYTAQAGTLTFNSGDPLTQTITVAINPDTVYEGNETFFVNLTNPTNAAIADPQGLGTITDDDAVPTASVAVAPASVPEDDVTSLLTYTVTLDHASAFATTVNFTLTGTATQGTDYTPSIITGSITIAAGSTTGTITVDPTTDTTFEPDETVIVTLTGGTTNGQAIGIGVPSATGTITNDDSQPTISINDVTVSEGAGSATFNVTLSNPSSQTITVQYQTANGSATGGADYTGSGLQTLTFAPGVTSQNITVPILEDTLVEGNETFEVNLSVPTNATILDTQGVGTILDNDTAPLPTLTINDVTVNESAGTASFTVTLSAISATDVTVSYATSDGSAKDGVGESGPGIPDYTATNGTLTILANTLTGTITVPITNDTVAEGTENFTVTLSTPVGATIADGTGVGTITDNDTPTAIIAVAPVSVQEGNPGSEGHNLVYTVTLDRASASDTVINFTIDVTARNSATPPGGPIPDYTISHSGSITILAGSTTGFITVDPIADTQFEPRETVKITLTGGTTNGQSIIIGSSSSATGSILNDDQEGGGQTQGASARSAGALFFDDGQSLLGGKSHLLSAKEAGGGVLNIADLLTEAGVQGDLGEYLKFDTQTSPGNTLVSLDTDGAGPAVGAPLVTLTGMVIHDLSALLGHNPDYTP